MIWLKSWNYIGLNGSLKCLGWSFGQCARVCVCVRWMMMVVFFHFLFFAIVRHQYRTSDRFHAYRNAQLHADSFIGRRKRWCKLMSAFCDPHRSRAPVRTINAPLTLAETVTASDSGTIFVQYVGSVIFQLQSSESVSNLSPAAVLSIPPPRTLCSAPSTITHQSETIRLHANAVLLRSWVSPRRLKL